MATIVRYVNAASVGGGTGQNPDITDPGDGTQAYASLSEWEAAEEANLITAGDIHECRVEGTTNDTTQLVIDTWTTGASNYIRIVALTTHRCDGVSGENSGTGYQLRGGTTRMLDIKEDYVRFEGFEVTTTSTFAACAEVTSSSGVGSSDLHFDDMIFSCTSATVASDYGLNLGVACTYQIRNCLFNSHGHRGCRVVPATGSVEHSTAYGDGSLGFLVDASSSISYSCAGGYTSEDFFTGGSAPGGDYNASVDTSASTDFTNNIVSMTASNEWTSPNVDPASADMSLLGSSQLVDAATGSTEPFDIADTARSTPDIGCFEVAAVGGGGLPAGSLALLGVGV